MQTPLMPRRVRALSVLTVSVSLLLVGGAATVAATAFAASIRSAAAIADTPSQGVSTVTMPRIGTMVLYPAHVYSAVPFLLMVSAPATGLKTTIRLVGGAHTIVATQYVAAQGARHLDWQQIQRVLTPMDRAGSVTIGAPPSGLHVQYEWVAWWTTLPRVGRRTIRVEYVSSARQYTSHADIAITAVRAPRHGALVAAYPYAPTYRVWPHPGVGALPQDLTVVASASAQGQAPMVETYDAAVSRPSTLALPLPAAVASQASALGARGTVTDLLYEQTPHPYAPVMASYTALTPTVHLLPPGQPADSGAWGWLTRIL